MKFCSNQFLITLYFYTKKSILNPNEEVLKSIFYELIRAALSTIALFMI